MQGSQPAEPCPTSNPMLDSKDLVLNKHNVESAWVAVAS